MPNPGYADVVETRNHQRNTNLVETCENLEENQEIEMNWGSLNWILLEHLKEMKQWNSSIPPPPFSTSCWASRHPPLGSLFVGLAACLGQLTKSKVLDDFHGHLFRGLPRSKFFFQVQGLDRWNVEKKVTMGSGSHGYHELIDANCIAPTYDYVRICSHMYTTFQSGFFEIETAPNWAQVLKRYIVRLIEVRILCAVQYSSRNNIKAPKI